MKAHIGATPERHGLSLPGRTEVKIEKLTEKNLSTLAAPERGNRTYYDRAGRGSVPGLGLRVTAAGARAWVLDYSNAAGARRRFTLGRWPDLTLEQARQTAAKWRARIYRDEERIDPLDEKQREREQAQAERRQREQEKTVAQVAELWQEGHALANKRPKSRASDASALRCHILPRLGSRKISDLTHKDIESLMRGMQEIPIQANRTLALLTTLVRYAIRQGFRVGNPCEGVKRYPEEEREVHLSRAQLDRLYAALEDHPQRQSTNAVKLLVWTGARRNEVLGARWKEFDLDRGLWMRPAARLKQKKRSSIPLNPLALDLLRDMRKEAKGGELLFPGARGDKPLREIKRFWHSVCQTAKLEGLRLHDLRHVFASVMLERGVPLATIAPLLGHASTVMTRRYAHLSEDALRAATGKAAEALALPGAECEAP